MKIFFSLLSLFCLSFWSYSQTISGNLSYSKNERISLYGFNGLENHLITSTTSDEAGNFLLRFSETDFGMGFLQGEHATPFLVVLANEDIEIKGEVLSVTESINIEKGRENQWFYQYASEHPRRNQALNAWEYLENLYKNDPLFSSQRAPNKSIQDEKQRIYKEDTDFLKQLPKDSYVNWYLPLRSLISEVSIVAQYRTEEISSTIETLRKIDYTDIRLYKSGLFKDAIDNHYWFLENSGYPLDSVYIEMQKSIDAMMLTLVKDEEKLNEITDYLFNLLEKHSLFKASEYLALKVLEDDECGCSIKQDVADQLEQYRAMKIGNLAPDIDFSKQKEFRALKYEKEKIPSKLSEIQAEYNLVVFGSSWCPKCGEEIPKIIPLYENWKKQGVEVVFISLDTEKERFQKFSSYLPFISVCDYKKWEGDIARNYYVSGTPTMYLLDKNRKIILRPISIEQVNSWIEWFIGKGNK